jgi:hypothetical protein
VLSGAGGRVDKDDELGRSVGGFGFAQADGFDALIVQPIILRQIVATNFCASFGEQAQLVAIALFVRAGNHTENKLIFLEILSDLIEGLFILQFCAIRLIEYFLGVVSEFLAGFRFGRREMECCVNSLLSWYPRFSKKPRRRKLCWRASMLSRKAVRPSWASLVRARVEGDILETVMDEEL